MVTTIIIIINIILLIYSFFHVARYFIFVKKRKQRKTILKQKTNIIIVIPCLYEQNTIVDTIDYFKNIIYDTIPILLVTSQKEKKKPTTNDIIKKEIINKYKNIFLIDYPHKNGIMADQLNYALKNLDKIQIKTDNNTYFCVYNADSRPSKDTFKELNNVIINKNHPEFIQQYSYALSNYSKLNFILKGFAIYQSNFELKCGLLNSFFNSKILHKHLVGHGLFIRLDILKKINGFNNYYWCEDIYMTAIANNMNYEIYPLLSLENMETPDKLSKLIKQNSVWFGTTSKNIKMYRTVFNECGKKTLNGYIGMFNELRSAINWLLFPIIIIILFSLSTCYSFYTFLISLFIYSIYVFVYSYTTIKIINRLNHEKIKYSITMFLSTFLATLTSNIGPLYYLFMNPKEKYKTER